MVLWALLLGLLLVSPPAKAELERVEHAAKAGGRKMAEIFFVDTTPFVANYFIDPKDHVYDWKGISPRLHYINNLLLELESGLRESTAKWKIVVGHHTIKSAGHHGNTHELAIHLLPILQVESTRNEILFDGQGFMSVEMTETDVDIKFYDVFGNAIYKWSTSKLISSAM
ncbi:hypothetical protein Gohar_009105 [Gossypium harknessii]|uniref:Calcineurin-like phosphoesterase domain-containing protein n=1 Tax=Gossypium harknessii TaxID=34285 RepID=A0A7J9GLV0_9ROSI|nr:hypothetical protein [Gossypium harknessii]